MMLGYAKNHASDTYYRMYNPRTKKVSETQDVHAWADWNRVDPKNDMSIFNENPDLLGVPTGLDAIEIITQLPTPPVTSFHHLIPED